MGADESLVVALTGASVLVAVLATLVSASLHLLTVSLTTIQDRDRKRSRIEGACLLIGSGRRFAATNGTGSGQEAPPIGRPSAEMLKSAWKNVIENQTIARSSDNINPNLAPFLVLKQMQLDESGSSELLRVCRKYINVINDELCELIDSHLIEPQELARRRPDVHLQLLSELPLIAPVVWYLSLVRKEGRVGYRLLLLLDILQNLRPSSMSEKVRLLEAPVIGNVTFGAYACLRSSRAQRRRLTITRREKVRQNSEARHMTNILRVGVPFEIPDPETLAKELRQAARLW